MNGVGFDSSAVRGPRCYGLTSFAVEDRPGSTLPTFAQCKTSSREENDGSLLPAHGDTMTRYLFLALLAISSTASAVVIRGDVDDAEYRIPAAAFPALADMPGEGHGVLIAPQWVVTAAHAAPMQGMDADVRSEEHTSELQSLMRISYALFCLHTKRLLLFIVALY